MKKLLLPLLALCFFVPFLAGCTAADEPAPEVPVPTPVPEPVPVVESPVLIIPDQLAGIPVSLSAIPMRQEDALYFTFVMDAQRIRDVIPPQGYPMMVIFFAYKKDTMPPGFSPESPSEIRESGIPYKTRSLHIYPGNIITHYEQVPEFGSPSRLFDPDKPYVYGAAIELRRA